MPLVTYAQTRPWAQAIARETGMKMMPPWFADPRYGHFANDSSLTEKQIATSETRWEVSAPFEGLVEHLRQLGIVEQHLLDGLSGERSRCQPSRRPDSTARHLGAGRSSEDG